MSASHKRPLTPDESEAIRLLGSVRFAVASWDKRFHRDVLTFALASGMIGEKAAPQLWRLFIRYRRQINSPDKFRLLALAQDLTAPDLRKLEAARRYQARIDALKAAAK